VVVPFLGPTICCSTEAMCLSSERL
jgi:hypothetical protein